MTHVSFTRRLVHWARAWDRWWLRTGPPHALAFSRIGIGVYLLIAFGLKLPAAPMMYSTSALVLPADVPWLPDILRFALVPPPPYVATLLVSLFLTATVLMTIGYAMRLSIAVMLLLYGWLYLIDMHQFWVTYEKLISLALGILLLSGADKTWSLRMRLRNGSWTAWEPVNILPQRLIAFQITATYLGVGWQKMWLPAWRNGDILYYSFISRWGSPPAYWLARLGLPYQAYDLMNVGVKFFEVTIPFGLWMPSIRKWYFLAGAGFHLFIAVFLEIWQFLVLIPMYILFLEPEDAKHVLERNLQAIKRGLSSM